MRLFIAVNFSDQIRAALLDTIQQLCDQGATGNFTRQENLHLTLAFIGESSRLATLQQILDRVPVAPFSLHLGKAGQFGDLYWVGIQKCPPLSRLAESLRQDLQKHDFSIDRKPFRPHITIARQVQIATQPHLTVAPATMLVENVSLLCSERINGRLTYTELYTKML